MRPPSLETVDPSTPPVDGSTAAVPSPGAPVGGSLTADLETGELDPPKPLEAEAVELPAGTAVGRYVISRKLGAGGMGVVYAAEDSELKRAVALKLLRLDPGKGPDASRVSEGKVRLLREAQALAQLSHPNVVAVHDVGTFQDSVFMAMELVEGENLRAWQKAAARPWREVVKVFLQAGKGLQAAHAKGLIHRDFKPDNVILAVDGRVCVLDFGLARTEKREPEPSELETHETAVRTGELLSAELTRVGTVVGTLAYMAPGSKRTPTSSQETCRRRSTRTPAAWCRCAPRPAFRPGWTDRSRTRCSRCAWGAWIND